MFTLTAQSQPASEDFLRVIENGTSVSIQEFILRHKNDSEDALKSCRIWYRGIEKSFQEIIDEYVSFSNNLSFFEFSPPLLVLDTDTKAAIYFTTKAKDCLHFARFFTIKSALLLDTDFNVNWVTGYVSQFMFRCIYFGTASTWYANCFDHILQIVYWGNQLYTSVKDRHGKFYNSSWDAKKVMAHCTYDFVVSELKKRNLSDIRELLTACSKKIEEIKKWSNFIKHKGGLDYEHLEAPSLFDVYLQSVGQDRVKIEDFKSPIKIDIDDKLSELNKAHKELFACLTKIVDSMNFDGKAVQFISNTEEISQ